MSPNQTPTKPVHPIPIPFDPPNQTLPKGARPWVWPRGPFSSVWCPLKSRLPNLGLKGGASSPGYAVLIEKLGLKGFPTGTIGPFYTSTCAKMEEREDKPAANLQPTKTRTPREGGGHVLMVDYSGYDFDHNYLGASPLGSPKLVMPLVAMSLTMTARAQNRRAPMSRSCHRW
jgi:hypothetical protein